MALTQQQAVFAAAVAAGAPPRQAYLAAFPNSRRWQPATVEKRAAQLLTKPEVAAASVERQPEPWVWSKAKCGATLEWLLERAQRQAEQDGALTGPLVSAVMGAVKELNQLHQVYGQGESGGQLERLIAGLCPAVEAGKWEEKDMGAEE